MCVHSSQNNWHFILGFQTEGKWLHCYDPYPHSKRFIKNDAVEFVSSSGNQEPNLRIRFDWLEKDFDKIDDYDERKYVLGSFDDRECLLLNRIHK
jgi:hypothetical protein